jgi:hypothetical protein
MNSKTPGTAVSRGNLKEDFDFALLMKLLILGKR